MKRAPTRFLGIYLLCALFLGDGAASAKAPCSIQIVDTNAENFFDWIPSNLVEDWGYRDEVLGEKNEDAIENGNPPSASVIWNEPLFQKKLANFLEFLREVGLPPILVGVEIENENVAHKIAAAAGYDSIFKTDGDDPRGINIVNFVRESENLKVTSVARHRLVGRAFAAHPTRQILEVQFRVGGDQKFILFSNHWPSQMGPTSARYAAASILSRLVRERMEAYPQARIMATGDFNTVDREEEPRLHPFSTLLLDPRRADHLVDVHDRFLASKNVPTSRKRDLAPGTYYYVPRAKSRPPEWNRFDRFLVSENMLGRDGLKVDLPTYDIVVTKVGSQGIVDREGKEVRVPRSFEPGSGEGVTDHFPVTVHLKID